MSRKTAKRQKVSTLSSCPNPFCKWSGCYLSQHIAQSIHCLSILKLTTTRTTNLADESDDENELVVANDNSTSVDISDDESNGSINSVANSSMDDYNNIRPYDELIEAGYSKDLYVETKLLKLLNDKKVHFSLFNDIVQWGKEASNLQYSFNPERLHRHSQVRYLEKILGAEDARPQQVQVVLTNDPLRTVTVTTYDFCTQYLSLLQSDVFQDLNNLDVNPESPFTKYVSPTGLINCINAGR